MSNVTNLVNFGTLARLRMGETIVGVDCTGDGIPVYSADTRSAPWNYSSHCRVVNKKGTIVIGARGSIGNPRLPKFDEFASTQTTIVAEPNKERVFPEYLWHALRAIDFSTVTAQQAVPMLTVKDLQKILVPVFSLEVQEKIATLLQSADAAIEKTESLIEKYQHIKAGLMHDLFTRGVLPNGQLRPRREEAPELYQPTEAGYIPKDWSLKTLGSVCDWFSGGTPSKRNEAWWRGTLPWLSPKDMKIFDISDTEDHITEQAASCGSRIVPKNTVFIVVRGMILAHSFPVVVNGVDFAFNQDIKALIPRGSLNGRYLAYWLVASKELMLKKTTESTHGTKRFDLKDLYSVDFGIPDENEQCRIIDRLEVIEKMLRAEALVHDKLKAQKSGLMQDLLTGKVPVPVPEHEATDG